MDWVLIHNFTEPQSSIIRKGMIVMSKNVALKNILLGFLNLYSMTGYELKQLIDNSINNVWNVNLSQIYPTLSDMKAEGLLEMDFQINEGTPNSKLYHITDRGKAELQEWMEETTPLTQTRNLFLAKLLVGAKFDKSILLSQIESQLALHQEKFKELKAKQEGIDCQIHKKEGIESTLDLAQYDLCLELALDCDIRAEEAAIQWCRHAIERIQQLEKK